MQSGRGHQHKSVGSSVPWIVGRSFLRGLPSIVLVSCPLSLPASSDSAAVSGGEGEARATTTSIFTVGVSYPFSQEIIIL